MPSGISSMTVDGAWLGDGDTYGLTVTRGPFPITTQPRVDVMNIAQVHGGINQGGKRIQMLRGVNYVIHANNHEQLREFADNLAWKLDPDRTGDVEIRFDTHPGRHWIGRLDSPIIPDGQGATSLQGSMVFSLTPYALDDTEIVQTVTIDESPELFNVPATGTVLGNIFAVPVWKIENTDAATFAEITLTNSTTSQSARSTKEVQQNEFIRFDSDRQILEFSVDDSTYTSAMDSFGAGGVGKTFLTLAPRVANACTLTGLLAGTLTITYRPRY